MMVADNVIPDHRFIFLSKSLLNQIWHQILLTANLMLEIVRCGTSQKYPTWDSSLTYSPSGITFREVPQIAAYNIKLDDTLLKHSLCNLHEACDVSTLNVVNRAIWLLTELNTCLVDRLHDEVKLLVNLLTRP